MQQQQNDDNSMDTEDNIKPLPMAELKRQALQQILSDKNFKNIMNASKDAATDSFKGFSFPV